MLDEVNIPPASQVFVCTCCSLSCFLVLDFVWRSNMEKGLRPTVSAPTSDPSTLTLSHTHTHTLGKVYNNTKPIGLQLRTSLGV